MENIINKIIQERRSIYPHEYNGKQVEEQVIHTLLENANYAPNHLSNYPWYFQVMQGESLHAWLQVAAELYQKESPPEKFKPAKFDKIIGYKEKVSHAIVLVMRRDPNVHSVINEDISAVAAAVQNMYLSLAQFEHAGGYWSTGLGTYSASMHQYLNLQADDTLMGFFILGAVDKKRTETNRKDWRQRVMFR